MNRLLAAALVPTLAGFTAAAQAADNPWDKTFTLQVGAYRADASTTVRLDADVGAMRRGTTISLEGDLGVTETDTQPEAYFLWRFSKHHSLEGSWVSLDRSGSRTIDAQIEWGDVTFPISSHITSSFKSDTLRVAYAYSPINDQGTELAFLIGLHYSKLEATAGIGNSSVSDSADVDFPLPTIGLRGSARIADTWRVTGFGQLLKLKIDEYDGELIQAGVGIEWAFHPSAYLGVGYNYYKYNLVSEKQNARGEFDYRFDGPSVYLGYSF